MFVVMERQQCKLCSRSFSNGKALGGHMRSHLFPLPIPPKQQLGGELTESILSLKEERGEISEGKDLIYGLKENPKKSYKLVDPRFLEPGSGFIVMESESETESRTPTRKRSTRVRKLGEYCNDPDMKNVKFKKLGSTESTAELEVVSSVYDNDSSNSFEDEEVASCLMMLAKDKWRFRPPSLTRERYECETCNKVFESFRALGGHRTSHKKVKNRLDQEEVKEKSWEEKPRKKVKKNVAKKMHECPICLRVFGSGQALGGHKRSHFMGSSSSATSSTTSPKQYLHENNGKNIETHDNFDFSFIDLNLPAPVEYQDSRPLEALHLT